MIKRMNYLLLINFKAYESSIGKASVKLAKEIESAAKESEIGVDIGIAVQPSDIFRFSDIDLPVFSQHIDPVEYGANTGYILPEAVFEAGAVGSLINHSEKPLTLDVIDKTIKRAKETDLIQVVCASTPKMAAAISSMDPDFIAIEPPELIGGEVSVSKANPDIITDTINSVHDVNDMIPVLCGAGIKNSEDVRIAIELGARGILVASGVTKASDPKKATLELLKGFK
ncbi:MAG: triose-phosphate isomerase [Candidatus Micrarchaeia archaeon]